MQDPGFVYVVLILVPDPFHIGNDPRSNLELKTLKFSAPRV